MSHKLLDPGPEGFEKIYPNKAQFGVCWLSPEQTKESDSSCSTDLKIQKGQEGMG